MKWVGIQPGVTRNEYSYDKTDALTFSESLEACFRIGGVLAAPVDLATFFIALSVGFFSNSFPYWMGITAIRASDGTAIFEDVTSGNKLPSSLMLLGLSPIAVGKCVTLAGQAPSFKFQNCSARLTPLCQRGKLKKRKSNVFGHSSAESP